MKGFELCPHTCNPHGCLSHTKTPLWRVEGGACSRHAIRYHSTCGADCPAFGLTERSGRVAVRATGANLAEFIPSIRQQCTLSDEAIATILGISVSDVNRYYPLGAHGKGRSTGRVEVDDNEDDDEEGKDDSDDDDDEEEEEEEEEDADRYRMQEDHDLDLGWNDMDVDVDVDVDADAEDLSPVEIPTEVYRAPSVGSYASENSFDTTFSELSSAPKWHPRIVPPTREHKRFRIIYIPDPSRQCDTVRETDRDLAFTTRTISAAEFEMASRQLPNLIFHAPGGRLRNKNMVKARIYEWVRVHATSHVCTNQFPALDHDATCETEGRHIVRSRIHVVG